MGTTTEARGGRPGRSGVAGRLATVGIVAVLIVAVVACRPLPLGGASNRIGNDPSACPQFQPSPTPPCGPQPLLWAGIQGPYETFANGDPYATKCARNSQLASESACSTGPYAGGATNELYDPTGYEYAIDVGDADVGQPLTFQIWDAGSYARRVSSNATTTRTQTATRVLGSTLLTRTGTTNFTAADVGWPITGTGIPAGTTIESLVSSTQVIMSAPATASSTGTTTTITYTTDCRSNMAPFTTAPYTSTSWGVQHCQTGDSGNAPLQVQVFDNDGVDDGTFAYDSPISACHLYVPPNGAGMAAYKNAWATVCTFTPTMAGVYPVRIKSSAIVLPDGTPVTDTGSGYNTFALRVAGGTATRLHATGAMSIWLNTPASSPQVYLAEITTEDAGKRLQIDLFDVGDGNSGQYTLQVLAPPSGAPGVVPSAGTVIPAPGYADSCRYNPTASPTRGPDVAAPNGADAPNCQVVTKFSSSGSSVYNNSWLSIEIDIAEDYVCDTDCWWTVRYDFGTTSSLPTDRTVWSPFVFDKPAPPPTTTTTTESTTTTTESTVPGAVTRPAAW